MKISPRLTRTLWIVFCIVLCLPALSAQLLPNPAAKPNGAAPDPFGRDTPSGTLFGFLQAAQAGKFAEASQYLQMSAAKRQSQGEDLASKLKVVIDRAFSGNPRNISNQPEGSLQDGVPLDRQRLGTLSAGDMEVDLTLVRVTDASGSRVWLFSADTLAKVPDLYDQVQVHQVETRLPGFLVHNQFLGMSIWQWLAILVGIPIAAILGWCVTQVLRIPRRYWEKRSRQPVRAFNSASQPLWLVISTVIHGGIVSYLRIPLLHRHYYQQIAGVIIIIGFNWLLWRVGHEVLRRVRERVILNGRTGTGSLILLGERILKAVIFVIAVLAILSTLGFNLSAALAGLGIGGIAIAFAAQKTLENLFGGLSVLGDEVIRIGDTCKFGTSVGTVEDISLRSTRIRTPERTELSIPNGSLATMNVENLSRRDKILFNPKLGLRYETTADQLRLVLAQLRRLLYEHPKVETQGARARFTNFDDSTLTIEIFAYVLTRDYAEYLAIREDLLLRIMDLVNNAGTGFAFPSQTLYLGKDSGLDPQKIDTAHQNVRQWRDSGNLPFPDYRAEEISGFSNSLPYPPEDSALRKKS
ncbi:MAG: mechanosensitive ion channel family protein [Acidobacteria bacterium]|nr:mechanosensitive ion channel family protein [Acidobacteriota bacterium]